MRSLKCVKWLWPLAGALLCLLVVGGCKRDEAIDPQGTGYVEANHAYQENFGNPPQAESGNAFARVVYLPLRSQPEKLRALPLFLLDQQDQLRRILQRLISGELLAQRDSPLYQPFPQGLAMELADVEGPDVTINLRTGEPWPPGDMLAGCRALAETALQFESVQRVIILVDGQPAPQMPASGFEHDQEILVRVLPPTVVMAAGVWEQGTAVPAELLVEFDRPIKIKNFQIYDRDGHAVDGNYFTSTFHMVVVIQPQVPVSFSAGDQVRVVWEVADELGRGNSGTSILPLRRLLR